ncbi:MAG: cysteine desulfurase-like protein [Elainellaceae cyanobacterium]
MTALDLEWIRSQFPALAQKLNGQPIIFFDGPGGTQVPIAVPEAISQYLLESNSNTHGAFFTSERTDRLVIAARSACADLLGCDSDEIVFGANMSTLTFMLSRAIGRDLQPGDKILVTTLDHYANVSSWQALEEQGVIVRTVDIHTDDCTLDLDDLKRQLNDRTRLVAVGYASNAVGTINDVATITELAHQVGAMVFVDAVHYAPHAAIDVRSLDCDFLVCSGYKFFGPHLGVLYGKRQHLEQLRPYKVQPAPNQVPDRWETGTLNFEALAGVMAAVDYLAAIGYRVISTAASRRAALLAGLNAIQAYERELSQLLISGLLQIPGITVYGITDSDRFDWRTPTVSIRLDGYSPYKLAKQLGDRGIFVWNGNVYALGLTERLEIEDSGGFVRIGLVHYNTKDEVNRLLQVLDEITTPALSVD